MVNKGGITMGHFYDAEKNSPMLLTPDKFPHMPAHNCKNQVIVKILNLIVITTVKIRIKPYAILVNYTKERGTGNILK